MKSPQSKLFEALALAWQLGFLIVVPMGGLLLAGIWLDSKLQTKPVFLLLGMLLGTIVGTILLTRRVLEILKDEEEE